MSLNESLSFESLPEPPDDEISILDELREAVAAVMAIDDVEELHHREHYGVAFRGTLQLEPEEVLAQLNPLLEPLGFTAFLQRDRGQDVVLAAEGLQDADTAGQSGGGLLRRLMRVAGRSPGWLHLALLLATIATTMYAGAILLDRGTLATAGDVLRAGGPFALTLLFILGVHEMGHYVAARRHRAKVTLPFFVPLPIPGSLGTLGAVIFIRSALKTRRALFDVGISGPLAGLTVALPLFVIGLLLPPIAFGAPINMVFRGVGVPPLLDFLGSFVVDGSLSRAVLLHPVALAAWFGVLLTALNLLPLGQFDGGHVAYALFGRGAWPLALSMFSLLILMGFLFWPVWFIWAFLAGLTGLRHPPPNDDITRLDIRRTLLGWLTILIFLLIIVPQPIIARQASFINTNRNSAPMPTIAVPDIPTPAPFDPSSVGRSGSGQN
jgi:membrane-associated protease RseP (regulator of RpoE activity)